MTVSPHTFRFCHSLACFFVGLAFLGCASHSGKAAWPPVAKKWFDRAEFSYRSGDLDDAEMSVENALTELPQEQAVRLLAARIHLAQLRFDDALDALAQLPGTEAAGLRGRCYWYQGRLDEAAGQLEQVVADPDIKDGWARSTLALARSGRGRRPFEISGALLAAVEMPRVPGTTMFVPLEVDGEPSLAVVATDRVETVVDGRDTDWVSLRFGGSFEVNDVPVVGQDLSGMSRELGVPVKMLIGVHLLRRLRATVDLSGHQFVARSFDPPPPPEASTIEPVFYKGGAMVLPGAFGAEQDAPSASLLMNTSMSFPLALDEAGWQRAGRDPEQLINVPGQADIKQGSVPFLRFGAFEVTDVPGVLGAPISAIEKESGADLDGAAGSRLFATLRLTFADGGRTLWVEDLPAEVIEMRNQIYQEARRRQLRDAAAADSLLDRGEGSPARVDPLPSDSVESAPPSGSQP